MIAHIVLFFSLIWIRFQYCHQDNNVISNSLYDNTSEQTNILPGKKTEQMTEQIFYPESLRKFFGSGVLPMEGK